MATSIHSNPNEAPSILSSDEQLLSPRKKPAPVGIGDGTTSLSSANQNNPVKEVKKNLAVRLWCCGCEFFSICKDLCIEILHLITFRLFKSKSEEAPQPSPPDLNDMEIIKFYYKIEPLEELDYKDLENALLKLYKEYPQKTPRAMLAGKFAIATIQKVMREGLKTEPPAKFDFPLDPRVQPALQLQKIAKKKSSQLLPKIFYEYAMQLYFRYGHSSKSLVLFSDHINRLCVAYCDLVSAMPVDR